MARKRVLPGIDAVYDDEGVTFACEGEPLDDMDFSWEDLADEEVRDALAEELAEYLDGEELEALDNPEEAAGKALRQLLRTPVARHALDELEDDDDDDDDGDDLDDYGG